MPNNIQDTQSGQGLLQTVYDTPATEAMRRRAATLRDKTQQIKLEQEEQ